MSNKAKLQSALQELRTDNRHKQKLGLHFILASVFIWVAVLAIQLSSLPILTKNLLTFCCSLLIAMWVYAAVPEKMLMVYAMIFGAHLLPYGWLYQSKSYYFFSLAIPIAVLLIGICCSPAAIAIFMLIAEIIFCMLLVKENRHTK